MYVHPSRDKKDHVVVTTAGIYSEQTLALQA